MNLFLFCTVHGTHIAVNHTVRAQYMWKLFLIFSSSLIYVHDEWIVYAIRKIIIKKHKKIDTNYTNTQTPDTVSRTMEIVENSLIANNNFSYIEFLWFFYFNWISLILNVIQFCNNLFLYRQMWASLRMCK